MTRLNKCKSLCAILFFCTVMVIASSAQTFTTLMSFDDTNGSDPTAALAQGRDGNFYGTTVLGGTGMTNVDITDDPNAARSSGSLAGAR